MLLSITMDDPEVWWRKSTREWIVSVRVTDENTSLNIRFTNKKLNKAKKALYKWCISGPAGESLFYQFSMGNIHFRVRN